MIDVPPRARPWKPEPAPVATAPDTNVNLNGSAPSSAYPDAVSSTVKRPCWGLEEVT